MGTIQKMIWPVCVGILLAVLMLKGGSSSLDNPLSDDPIAKWFSVSQR